MGTRTLTVTVAAVLAVGCASATPVDIRTMLDRGAENSVQRGTQLRVQGYFYL